MSFAKQMSMEQVITAVSYQILRRWGPLD